MTKERTTWVLIADGARARIYEMRGAKSRLQPVEGMDFSADHRPTHELMSDRAGRVVESHGSAHHGIEAKSDPHRELKRDFAKSLAATLDAKHSAKAFDRLVIAAPAKTLGDLRDAMPASVKAVVSAEIDKDLTKTPLVELADHLGGHIP